MKPLQENSILIAEPFLKDKDFMRTVVYLCKHTNEGSVGFVLNRLFSKTLDQLIDDLIDCPLQVYIGGPVEKDTIHFIHQYPDLIPGSYQLDHDMYWGGDFEILIALIKKKQIDFSKLKFFIGYSGWSAGQLEEEMNEKSWLTSSANSKIIFETKADNIWKESVKQLGEAYKEIIHYPIDPQLN